MAGRQYGDGMTLTPGSEVRPVRLWGCPICGRLVRQSVALTHQIGMHGYRMTGALRVWSVVRHGRPS